MKFNEMAVCKLKWSCIYMYIHDDRFLELLGSNPGHFNHRLF